MRYSALKLLYYINEATEAKKEERDPKDFDKSLPTGVKDAVDKDAANSPFPTPKPQTGEKKEKPLVDPSVLGDIPDDEKVAAETGGQLASGLYGAAKYAPGKAKALIGKGVLDVGLDLGMNAYSRLDQEMKAHQEAVRGMSNVSNFYKNLGTETIPLRKKDDKGVLGFLGSLAQKLDLLPGKK
jgi:hypothetical protein